MILILILILNRILIFTKTLRSDTKFGVVEIWFGL